MTPGRQVGVAVVGTGFGVLTHVPGYRACARVHVLALVGLQEAKTQRMAGELGIPHGTTDLEEALHLPGLDLVSIASTHSHHAPAAPWQR